MRVVEPQMPQPNLPDPVRAILERLWSAGFEAYVVGGSLRDLLLGRDVADWDVATSALPDQIQALSASKNVRIEKTPSCRIIYFGITQIKGGPIADRRVRQALNHAVDIQGIIDTVLLGNGKRINSTMPPNVWGYDPSIPLYD